MLVALSRAFDVEAIDKLLFLEANKKDFLVLSGDGLLHFARLIAAQLTTGDPKTNNNFQVVTYAVNLTQKGRQLVSAWKTGDRVKLKETLAGASTD